MLDMRRPYSGQSGMKQAGRQEEKANGEHHLGYRGQRVVQQEDKQRLGGDARRQKSEDVGGVAASYLVVDGGHHQRKGYHRGTVSVKGVIASEYVSADSRPAAPINGGQHSNSGRAQERLDFRASHEHGQPPRKTSAHDVYYPIV
jgi:hypothetical protein